MKISRDRYEFIGTLGAGASSRVDKARDSIIGRTVALKTFLHGFGSGDLQKQFLREAQIIGGLTHPSIVSLYDAGTNAEGVPYLVMEYVEGKTLERTLDAGPLPLERAAVWAADLASALARAHHFKIIHGDVKPANVLITGEGQVKLGDFGIARFATQISSSGNILGTPAYLSPEQILGHKQDTRSDLFSLGIILYQMTTGVRPFDGTSVGAVCAQIVSAEPLPPSHHNPALPPDFDHIVMRCLAKDPAKRYADAETLGASLYPFARSKPIPIAPPSRHWWKRPMQTSDLRAVAAMLAVLAILSVAAKAVHERSLAAAAQHAPPFVSAASMPDSSGARTPNSGEIAASPVISVGTSDLGGGSAGAAEQSPAGLSNQTASQTPHTAVASAESTSTEFSVASDPSFRPVPSVSLAFERKAAESAKAKTSHPASDSPSTLSSSRSTTASKSANSADASKPAAAPSKTSLHIDIVSGVTDETISIFSGDELLVSAPLEAAHLGDTLRFECPITAGEHSFRVVVKRSDDTVLVEKGSTSHIRSDASNFLGVHVIRRPKLFLKHETALEVVWPSAVPPVAVAASQQHPEGEFALR